MSIAQRRAGRPSTTRSGRPGPSKPAARQRSLPPAEVSRRSLRDLLDHRGGRDDAGASGTTYAGSRGPSAVRKATTPGQRAGTGRCAIRAASAGVSPRRKGGPGRARRRRRSGPARRAAGPPGRRRGRRAGRPGGAARATGWLEAGVVDAHGDRATHGLVRRRHPGARQRQRDRAASRRSAAVLRRSDDELHRVGRPGRAPGRARRNHAGSAEPDSTTGTTTRPRRAAAVRAGGPTGSGERSERGGPRRAPASRGPVVFGQQRLRGRAHARTSRRGRAAAGASRAWPGRHARGSARAGRPRDARQRPAGIDPGGSKSGCGDTSAVARAGRRSAAAASAREAKDAGPTWAAYHSSSKRALAATCSAPTRLELVAQVGDGPLERRGDPLARGVGRTSTGSRRRAGGRRSWRAAGPACRAGPRWAQTSATSASRDS